jgi:uncharacterized membrane protein
MILPAVSPSTLAHAPLTQAALTQVAATRADWTDGAALAVFLIVWIGYPWAVHRLGLRRGAVNLDMTVIRAFWMREMVRRPDRRLLDGQLLGHTLNTATFFSSTNLILIAAVAGTLFGGERTYRAVLDIPLLSHGPRILFEFKLILVLSTLAGGLLDFVWAIRQLGYCLALTGAAPTSGPSAAMESYADAASKIFDRTLTAYNSGVRGYYFSLAAAAWLVSPPALVIATLGAAGLLLARQLASPTARAIQSARYAIEAAAAADRNADQAPASTPTPIGQVTPVPPIPQ